MKIPAYRGTHAVAKYMDLLMPRYFSDADFSEANRRLFAFASYNAGPANIARMHKEAAKRGLDTGKCFNNVEFVVAQKLGWKSPPTCTSTTEARDYVASPQS